MLHAALIGISGGVLAVCALELAGVLPARTMAVLVAAAASAAGAVGTVNFGATGFTLAVPNECFPGVPV